MSSQTAHNKTTQIVQAIIQYIARNEDALASGEVPFTLNPGCLRLLNTYLGDRMHTTTPMGVQLLAFLRSLTRLRLESGRRDWIEDRIAVDLSLFGSLIILELDYVKPVVISQLNLLRQRIAQLTVRGCLNSLSELLDFEVDNAQDWPELTYLCCASNNIPEVDDSARLLVAVRKIDLSHNLISSVKNLQSCWKLEFLTLAFNRIADVSNINQMVGNLKILNLAHNSITTTDGLEKLYSLEQLDISNNLIAKLPDVERLRSLPLLHSLWLNDNPVTFIDEYREVALGYFAKHARDVVLDGVELSSSEQAMMKKLRYDDTDTKDAPAPVVSPRTLLGIPEQVPDTRVRSPGSSKKRKKKTRRVPSIHDPARVAREKGAVSEDLDELADTDAEFNRKVNMLREQGGPSWLLMFNELELETPGKPQETKADVKDPAPKKKRKRRRPKKKKKPLAAIEDGKATTEELGTKQAHMDSVAPGGARATEEHARSDQREGSTEWAGSGSRDGDGTGAASTAPRESDAAEPLQPVEDLINGDSNGGTGPNAFGVVQSPVHQRGTPAAVEYRGRTPPDSVTDYALEIAKKYANIGASDEHSSSAAGSGTREREDVQEGIDQGRGRVGAAAERSGVEDRALEIAKKYAAKSEANVHMSKSPVAGIDPVVDLGSKYAATGVAKGTEEPKFRKYGAMSEANVHSDPALELALKYAAKSEANVLPGGSRALGTSPRSSDGSGAKKRDPLEDFGFDSKKRSITDKATGATEEFFVTRFVDGSTEMRVLIVQYPTAEDGGRITESDLSSGREVMKIEASMLIAVADGGKDKTGNPQVQVQYRPQHSSINDIVVYHMENDDEHALLLDLGAQIVSSSSKYQAKMRCLSCEHVFSELLSVGVCPKCKGTYMVTERPESETQQRQHERSSDVPLKTSSLALHGTYPSSGSPSDGASGYSCSSLDVASSQSPPPSSFSRFGTSPVPEESGGSPSRLYGSQSARDVHVSRGAQHSFGAQSVRTFDAGSLDSQPGVGGDSASLGVSPLSERYQSGSVFQPSSREPAADDAISARAPQASSRYSSRTSGRVSSYESPTTLEASGDTVPRGAYASSHDGLSIGSEVDAGSDAYERRGSKSVESYPSMSPSNVYSRGSNVFGGSSFDDGDDVAGRDDSSTSPPSKYRTADTYSTPFRSSKSSYASVGTDAAVAVPGESSYGSPTGSSAASQGSLYGSPSKPYSSTAGSKEEPPALESSRATTAVAVEGTSSRHSSSSSNVSSLIEENERDSATVGLGLEDALKEAFFIRDERERLKYFHRCSCIRHNDPISMERRGALLVTTHALYVLVWSDSRSEYELVGHGKYDEVHRIVCGLFMQFIRVEYQRHAGFTLLSRDHCAGHAVVEAMKDGARSFFKADHAADRWVVHAMKETSRNMSLEVFDSEPVAGNIQLYMMVFADVAGGTKYEGGFSPQSNPVPAGMQPRSIILTSSACYLCIEDYTRWPSMLKASAPESAQFVVERRGKIEDVLGVEVDNRRPNAVCLLFEDNNSWSIHVQSVGVKQRLLKVLSRVWQDLYQVEFTVLEK